MCFPILLKNNTKYNYALQFQPISNVWTELGVPQILVFLMYFQRRCITFAQLILGATHSNRITCTTPAPFTGVTHFLLDEDIWTGSPVVWTGSYFYVFFFRLLYKTLSLICTNNFMINKLVSYILEDCLMTSYVRVSSIQQTM